MEKELNIAAILKEKPQYTGLWSPMLGNCKYIYITEVNNIRCNSNCNKCDYYLDKNGKVTKDGELMVYPSRNMRSWEKFAWKKGDVLRYSDILVIFEKWTTDDYTEFKALYEFCRSSNSFDNGNDYYTSDFCKAIDDVADNFIKKIEEHYGGKLNLETLTIEQPKPEFKDGDIVVVTCTTHSVVAIFKNLQIEHLNCYAYLSSELHVEDWLNIGGKELRLATDGEKQQLIDALAKEGKVWNPDTKQIEDLPNKCELKPFDKVLVRINNTDVWNINLFSYDRGVNSPYRYICVSGSYYQCIPYNDQTASLLGTTDEWKGGEG